MNEKCASYKIEKWKLRKAQKREMGRKLFEYYIEKEETRIMTHGTEIG